jgi:hypothetical protein
MGRSESARRHVEAGTEGTAARLAVPLAGLALWLMRTGALAVLLMPAALLGWWLLD